MNRRLVSRLALTALSASCLKGAPVVSPTATLAIADTPQGPRSRGEYAVVFAGPQGIVENRSEPGVTILLNRALRSLEDEDDNSDVPSFAVRTDEGEQRSGTWRWVGTRGLFFTPLGDLPGATNFHVKVPKGLKSLEGEALAADYTLSFSTERPRLLATEPKEGSYTLKAAAPLSLEFNQGVDPAEFMKVARLVVRADAKATPIPFHAEHPKSRAHAERTLMIVPNTKLPLDASIELTIDKGLRGEGPLLSEVASTLHVRTYGPLALALVQCPRVQDGALGRCQAHRDITVVLSNPVMPDEFRAHLKMNSVPRVPIAKRPPPPKTARALTEFALGADPAFGARYHLTLTAGMTDVYGQRLAKDATFDVDTEEDFTHPAVAAPTSRAQSDAPEPPPPPATIASRVLPPFSADLGITGYVIEALPARAHKLSAGVVNVPTFGLLGAKVSEREVKQVLLGTAAASGGFLAGGYRFAWESPNQPANTRYVESIDLDALLGSTRRGVGFIALGVVGVTAPVRQQLVNVTDLALSAKMSRFGSLVWVTSLSTGKPVVGAEVSIGATKKDDMSTFVTDARGLATIPAESFNPIATTKRDGEYRSGDIDDSVLFVKKDSDWTFERVEQGSNFQRAAGTADLTGSREWQAAVFTDRGVYRPGEILKLVAVVRQSDARGLTVMQGHDVRVSLVDTQGEKVFDGRAKLDAFGTVSLDLPIPKSAHLGDARAVVELPGSRDARFQASVLLADFKAVEFKVSAQPDKPDFVRGDVAHFSVHGEYLFQAPMAGAAAHVMAVREVTSFQPKNTDGFVTSDEAYSGDYGDKGARAGSLDEANATLDGSGNHDEAVDLAMPGQTQPERVAFEADVEDFTRQVVAGSASVIVHPADFYVGLRRPTSRFLAVGAPVSPDVVTVRPDGTRVAGNKVRVELLQRTWTTVVADSEGGDGTRRSKVEDVNVGACEVASTSAVASCGLVVPAAGYFIVRATASDRRGNVVRASQGLYALSDKPDVSTTALGWAENDARVLRLEGDKSTYRAGETAKVLVRNPFQEAEALITVERAGVMTATTMTLKGPMPVVPIEIADDYFPNVFVSVQLVRGRVLAAPATGADLGKPDYRVGYLELSVSPDSHRLKVEVKTGKKDYRPGEDVDADLVVRDATGSPTRASVTFYAVDEGVLMLTGYTTPDPLTAFTKRRALSVFGMDSRDHLATLTAFKAGERLRNLGYETLGGDDKGNYGGGGGEDGGSGGKRLDFRNTAFFEAGRVTATDGTARFHFKLPDNLTAFRLMAVASTVDRFGSGESSITSSKRLMARPALPRALRVGDKFDASVVVSGKGLGAVPVDVTLSSGSGAIVLEGATTQRVNLPATGNVEVHFPAFARGPGDSALTFTVRGAGETDSVQLQKHVAIPLHLESVAIYGETTQSAAISLGDLSKIRGDVGALDVHVSASALVGLEAAFDQLSDYPYGCTEQIASRMLPLVSLGDLARSAGVRVPARSDTAMDAAVSEMQKHQRDSGGFGYWDDDAEQAWLSAYALLALDTASKQGVFVPRDSLDRGIENLKSQLEVRTRTTRSDDTDDDDTPHVTPLDDKKTRQDREAQSYAEATFLADVLATLGRPDPGTLNRLFDARPHKPLFSQALLLHAMAVGHMPKAQTDALATELTSRLRVDADSAVAEETDALFLPLLDSATRTTALSLRALLAVDATNKLAPRLAKGLLAARKGGAWGSTQENAWALIALDDYRKAQESATPAFDVSVFLGKQSIGQAVFHDSGLHDEHFTLLPSKVKELGGPLSFMVNGSGKLFYSAELKAEIADLPTKALDRGLYVQKTMRAVSLADLDAAQRWIPRKTSLTASAGQLVIVDLIVETAEPAEQVVVSDPLPAGLEAIDFDLQTTGQLHAVRGGNDPKFAKGALDNLGMPFREAPFHREMHDDKVLTFFSHLDPGMVHLRYLARATVPGRYVLPPTSAECMYSPEVFGRTRAVSYEITR